MTTILHCAETLLVWTIESFSAVILVYYAYIIERKNIWNYFANDFVNHDI